MPAEASTEDLRLLFSVHWTLHYQSSDAIQWEVYHYTQVQLQIQGSPEAAEQLYGTVSVVVLADL